MLQYFTLVGCNCMCYEFVGDIHIEYPFYQRMAVILKSKKLNSNKKIERFIRLNVPVVISENHIFMQERMEIHLFLKCFFPECYLNSLPLHELIKRFGGERMFNEWIKASWSTTYEEDWFPVKNKVPCKDRAQKQIKLLESNKNLNLLPLK